MTVETYQKYQETFESADNSICQLKQRHDWIYIDIIICRLRKVHDDMAIPAVEKSRQLSSYLMLEYMVIDNGLSGGVTKNSAATILVDIVRLHKCTKTPPKYVHTNSEYGHLVSIPASVIHE